MPGDLKRMNVVSREVRQALALVSSYVIVAGAMLAEMELSQWAAEGAGINPSFFVSIVMLISISVSCGFFSNSLLFAPISAILGGLLGQLSIVLFRPGVIEYIWTIFPATSPSDILMNRIFLLVIGAAGSMVFWALTSPTAQRHGEISVGKVINSPLRHEQTGTPLSIDDSSIVESGLKKVVEVLREAGLELRIQPELRGRSGASHPFTVIAMDEGSVALAIDVKVGSGPIDKDALLVLWGKVMDTEVACPVIIAIPGLSEPAEKIANHYGIRVISSPSINEAAELLREELSRLIEETRKENRRREIKMLKGILKKIES